MPQAPQFSPVVMSISQPSMGSLLQSANPAAHAVITHAPSVHITIVGSTFGKSPQSFPHFPQLAVSFCVLMQMSLHNSSPGPLHPAPPEPPMPPIPPSPPMPDEVVFPGLVFVVLLPGSPHAAIKIPVDKTTPQPVNPQNRNDVFIVRTLHHKSGDRVNEIRENLRFGPFLNPRQRRSCGDDDESPRLRRVPVPRLSISARV